MLIISQNLSNYKISFPNNVIFRINLAWVSNLDELTNLLNKHKEHKIFIDLPKGRIKPPHNNYSISDLIPILKSYSNIKYFAISNVESSHDIIEYLKILPRNIILVPKIENARAVKNIAEITNHLSTKKIVMLDHDDLFASIIKANGIVDTFKDTINRLVEFCKMNNVILLRTSGVIFSDN